MSARPGLAIPGIAAATPLPPASPPDALARLPPLVQTARVRHLRHFRDLSQPNPSMTRVGSSANPTTLTPKPELDKQ
eukprot:10477123-Alexandrium_andersonii.AAC.1